MRACGGACAHRCVCPRTRVAMFERRLSVCARSKCVCVCGWPQARNADGHSLGAACEQGGRCRRRRRRRRRRRWGCELEGAVAGRRAAIAAASDGVPTGVGEQCPERGDRRARVRLVAQSVQPASPRPGGPGEFRAWLPLAAERASLSDEEAASSHLRRRGRGLKASLTPHFNLVMKIDPHDAQRAPEQQACRLRPPANSARFLRRAPYHLPTRDRAVLFKVSAVAGSATASRHCL